MAGSVLCSNYYVIGNYDAVTYNDIDNRKE